MHRPPAAAIMLHRVALRRVGCVCCTGCVRLAWGRNGGSRRRRMLRHAGSDGSPVRFQVNDNPATMQNQSSVQEHWSALGGKLWSPL